MKLLLTNDDGIDAPGLAVLERVAQELGEVVVVAPDRHLSGCSHQATTHEPIRMTEVTSNRFAVSGTPVDCVRLGLLNVAPDVDWVLSGVNDGGNLGTDVYLSGTVAAAREATLLGKRAMALSQYRVGEVSIDWTTTREVAKRVIEQLMSNDLPTGSFWNVNFPERVAAANRPDTVFCPLDTHPLHIAYSQENEWFSFQGIYQRRARQAGSDVDVCFSGHIAISEVRLGNLG